MNFRKVAPILVIASLVSPAVAQERVVVGTQRLTDNAALFLAAAAGYFKAEGIDLAMTLMRTIAWWPKRSRPAPQILRSPGSRRWPSTSPAKVQSRRSRHELLRGHRARRFQHRIPQGPAEIRGSLRQDGGDRRAGVDRPRASRRARPHARRSRDVLSSLPNRR